MSASGTSIKLHQMGAEMQQCINECLACHALCLETITYCVQKGGKHVEQSHLQLLTDCAEACQVSANFMCRGSELHGRYCAVCAEVCNRCAESCDKFGDDEQMKACAEACRRCAESCQRMAA